MVLRNSGILPQHYTVSQLIEDGGSTVLRDVGILPQTLRCHNPEKLEHYVPVFQPVRIALILKNSTIPTTRFQFVILYSDLQIKADDVISYSGFFSPHFGPHYLNYFYQLTLSLHSVTIFFLVSGNLTTHFLKEEHSMEMIPTWHLCCSHYHLFNT
jgi:hypothetical protein